MKLIKLIVCSVLSLAIATPALAQALRSGKDNFVEWQEIMTWDVGAKSLDMVHSLDGKFVFFLTEDGQVKIFDQIGQLQGEIPVGPDVSAIDISPLGEMLYLVDNTKGTFTAVSVAFVYEIDTEGAPFKGPADAPVTLTLFTDFQCPYCSKIEGLIDAVYEKNAKHLKVVFKNMPLPFHPLAREAASAALAAQEQGRFWEFHDKLFAEKELTAKKIRQIAVDLGLDMKKFDKDRNSAETIARIEKDLQDAKKAGVTGTPTVFINGRKPQQRSLAAYQALIDEMLRANGENVGNES
ncbi:MAG: hypothetical protein CSA20_04550 [Deltaproteobacteria bacterium]|nr:MAG: hypothetical protein CSB23_03190 [Deltaproteobacteria bacterium]PIE73354.1 MAG: hypothetical protein CSA20_04550 [Deltaproteobacteria bacterium]